MDQIDEIQGLRHPSSLCGAKDRVYVIVRIGDRWTSAVFVDGTAFTANSSEYDCKHMWQKLLEKNWHAVTHDELTLVCFGMSAASHDLPFWLPKNTAALDQPLDRSS